MWWTNNALLARTVHKGNYHQGMHRMDEEGQEMSGGME